MQFKCSNVNNRERSAKTHYTPYYHIEHIRRKTIDQIAELRMQNHLKYRNPEWSGMVEEDFVLGADMIYEFALSIIHNNPPSQNMADFHYSSRIIACIEQERQKYISQDSAQCKGVLGAFQDVITVLVQSLKKY